MPLLHGKEELKESPRWPEQPAHELKNFYHKRFNADVKQLSEIWSWNDYYRKIDRLVRQSATFDRIIFIGHGGFDGPILKNTVYKQEHKIQGNTGKLLYLSESQPGLKNTLSITYDTEKNPLFTDYIAAHWQNFGSMEFHSVYEQLTNYEILIQPLDYRCYQNYCSAEKLALKPPEQRDYQQHLCELICRKPLFNIKKSVELSTERLFVFLASLKSLLTKNGLIYFGSCNPGSVVPEYNASNNETELLITTTLAGGPYSSYAHLVSKKTNRIVAGPIGSASSGEILKRIIQLETNQLQHHLCIVVPGN